MPFSTLLPTLEELDRRGIPGEVIERSRPCSPNVDLFGFIGIITMDGGMLGILRPPHPDPLLGRAYSRW